MFSTFVMPTSPLDEALKLLQRGWYVVPLCWPDKFGKCACGKAEAHANREGKVPLITGYQDERSTEGDVRRWWGRWPEANIGVLLEPSGLVVLDVDGEAAVAEALQLGVPATLTVQTPNGFHYYFERPESWPVGRTVQKGESKGIDILSKLFTVAPPSLHRKGQQYFWSTALDHALGEPPRWLRKMLPGPAWLMVGSRMPKHRTSVHYDSANTQLDKLKSALSVLDPESYDDWKDTGMALKLWDEDGNGAGRGLDLWDEWSQRSGKYPGRGKLKVKWNSFQRKTGKNLGTIYYRAKALGWTWEYDNPNGAYLLAHKRPSGTWFNP